MLMSIRFAKYLLSAITLSVASCAFALPSSYYATTSRLASGRWVKIKVSESGVQRISYDRLRAWGFDNPEAVNVYGFSGSQIASAEFSTAMPDDLPLQYSEKINDALYFYGEGDYRLSIESPSEVFTTRDYYSTYSCYFLSDAEPGEAPAAARPYAESASSLSTCWNADYHEREEICPGDGGTYYYSAKIDADNPDAGLYNLHIDDYVADSRMTLTYVPVGRTKRAVGYGPVFPSNITVHGSVRFQPIPGYTIDDEGQVVCSPMPSPTTITCTPGSNDITDFEFRFPAPSELQGQAAGELQWVSVDYMALIYERHNRIGDHGQLTMHFIDPASTDNVVVDAHGAPMARVWDVTSPLNVTPLEASHTDDALTVSPAASQRFVRLVAFDPEADPSKFPAPEFVEETPNSNLHGLGVSPALIIITRKSLLDQAERLADLHRRHQGMEVVVVTDEQVYNEFSSGASNAIGLRRFVKMMYDRNPDALKYLCLFGRGSFDNRHIVLPDNDQLVTYQCTEDRRNPKRYYDYDPRLFNSDNFFGMLYDNFSTDRITRTHAAIGVGRIPVTGNSNARLAVDKIKFYLENYTDRDDFVRMLALSDRGDNYAHSRMAEQSATIASTLDPSIIVNRVYNNIFNDEIIDERIRLISNAFNRGAGYVMYAGHADTKAFGSPEILNYSIINGLHFDNRPVMFLATCHALNLDRTTQSVGMALYEHPEGPVAVISSGRQVYLNSNAVILDAFSQHVFTDHQTGAEECVGDAWRIAFNSAQTVGSNDAVCINTLCYNLAGDPAVPLAKPQGKLSMSLLNGAAPAEHNTVSALTPVTLEGYVTDAAGNVKSDFNGTVSVTVLERPIPATVVVDQNSSQEKPQFTLDEQILAKVSCRAVNGKFNTTLVMPQPSIDRGRGSADVNRVVLAAYGADDKFLASGNWTVLEVLRNEDPQLDDTTAPVISEMYLDDPSFNDGDEAGSTAVLYALINADPSGLMMSTSSIGNSVRLTLDNSTIADDLFSALHFNADGQASLRYRYSDLAPGRHTIMLNVSDNAGNRASREISFTVPDNNVAGILTVDNRIVTREGSTFDLSITGTSTAERFSIIDASGNTVHSVEKPVFPLKWVPAADVPEGNYRAVVTLRNAISQGATNSLDLLHLKTE